MDERTDPENELKEGDPCPLCGQPLVLRHSGRGDFLGCSDYPACTFMQPLGRSRAVETVLPMSDLCPRCGAPLALKKGRFGLFVGCTRYPECGFTWTGSKKSEITCPVCKKGTLVQRFSKSGREFYACTAYPDCTFSTGGRPVEKQCPECAFPLMFEKKTKKGVKLVCGNPLCPTRRHRILKHKVPEE